LKSTAINNIKGKELFWERENDFSKAEKHINTKEIKRNVLFLIFIFRFSEKPFVVFGLCG